MPSPCRPLACALVLALAALPAAGRATPSALETQVIEALNLARLQPRAFAQTLRDYRARFRGSIVYEGPGDIGMRTREGPRAVDEAVAFVAKQAPLPPVMFDPALARSAADHADDQARSGAVGHVGADGSDPGDRMMRYAPGRMLMAEIISYGEPTGPQIVRQLVIDDGQPDRGHRSDIFDPRLRRAGAACRSHPVYRWMCVIDLSSAPIPR